MYGLVKVLSLVFGLVVINPPETQLCSFCLCSGRYIVVNFSESGCPVQSFIEKFHHDHTLSRSLKMDQFNLVKNFTSL